MSKHQFKSMSTSSPTLPKQLAYSKQPFTCGWPNLEGELTISLIPIPYRNKIVPVPHSLSCTIITLASPHYHGTL